MTANLNSHWLNQKLLWFLATVFGFAVGWITGWFILDSIPQSAWTKIIFWVYPTGGAGLEMGLSQWILIHRIYKYAYFWIPITAMGFIAGTGSMLTLLVAVSTYFKGSFYSELGGMLVTYTTIAPIALLLGPFCQWLILRSGNGSISTREFLKIIVGWILAISSLYVMMFPIGALVQTSSVILNWISLGVVTIPSGLILAGAMITSHLCSLTNFSSPQTPETPRRESPTPLLNHPPASRADLVSSLR
jgi:hypothetical protein